MTLKQLKISEAKKIINSYKQEGSNIFTLVDSISKFNEVKQMKGNEERLIKAFSNGAFIHYAFRNLEGKGIVDFYDEQGLKVLEVDSVDKTIVSKENFNIANYAKNLAILSHKTKIKKGKSLLLKFANVHSVINDLDEILSLSDKIKIKEDV